MVKVISLSVGQTAYGTCRIWHSIGETSCKGHYQERSPSMTPLGKKLLAEHAIFGTAMADTSRKHVLRLYTLLGTNCLRNMPYLAQWFIGETFSKSSLNTLCLCTLSGTIGLRTTWFCPILERRAEMRASNHLYRMTAICLSSQTQHCRLAFIWAELYPRLRFFPFYFVWDCFCVY